MMGAHGIARVNCMHSWQVLWSITGKHIARSTDTRDLEEIFRRIRLFRTGATGGRSFYWGILSEEQQFDCFRLPSSAPKRDPVKKFV